MKRLTLWLLLIGSLLMIFTLLADSFINISPSLEDFVKGFGITLVVGALLLQKNSKKQIESDTWEK